MSKKVLFIATVVQKHINVFHLPYLKMFQENGYTTYVAAANDTGKTDVVIPYCDEYIEINFERNPLSIKNIFAYQKLKKLIHHNKFDIIHCHTPVGGLLGRLAARKLRKNGTTVFYTAHGFHFYNGSPLKNWIFYYPVEKLCSYFTDVLITINQEDYILAKKKMKATKVEYIPGVGIDVDKFKNTVVDKEEKRKELGIPKEALLLISVGELNENKNHQVIIKAMGQIKNLNIHYIVAGEGEKKRYLLELANLLGLKDNVHLLGYRTDIAELYKCADIFCFPSQREGLPVALMEAMASKLPIIAANNRGTRELMGCNNENIINDYNDINEYKNQIEKFAKDKNTSQIIYEKINLYEISDVLYKMSELYKM